MYLSAVGAEEGSDAQSIATRAGIVLTYAHLEGFSRHSIRAYFSHVRSQSLKYSELGRNFLSLKLSRIANQGTDKASYYGAAVHLLLKELEQVADLPEPDVISARSNLRFEQLREMLYCVNLKETLFVTKEHFMNAVLLERRNAIAHGEFRRPTLADYIEVHKETLEIIEILHTLLVDSANKAAYRT